MFLPFWITKQKVLVVLEAEFWYMLFLIAFKQDTKIILLNARISDRSESKYMKLKWFYKKILDKVDFIYTQSDIDKERFIALGGKNVEVIGNIKLSSEIRITKEYVKEDKTEFIVAGSTHDTEEEYILNAYVSYKKSVDAKLIIVPRHPERFDDVYKLITDIAKLNSLTFSRFSQDESFKADIVLVDKMGELNNIYAISDIAILGGAFKEDVGGHNPLEPANFGCKIITGKHFFHQKELFKYIKNIQYVENDEILDALIKTRELQKSEVTQKIELKSIINKILDSK